MNENKNNYNSDSDSEYINIESLLEDNKKNIYQFHLNNEKLIIKNIGRSTEAHDVIIKENFGPKLSMNLYNCIYMENEINIINNLFFPIIKLINYSNNKIIISSFAIKIKEEVIYEQEIKNWDLYWVQNIQKEDYINTKEISKNISPDNIIEKLLELSI